MDEELRQRFFHLKLLEFLTDSTRPFPVMIFEAERPEMVELIREFCLFSPKMIPYRVDLESIFVDERLDKEKVVDYGELYGLIFLC